MKLCQTCHNLAAEENSYCAHDGQPLVHDPLATALQESLGAKYTLTKLIGTGSMGAVYRAQHQTLDEVAIKVMLGPPDNHKLSERFLREARALRKLHHQHSVLVYDLERSPTGLTYMVMEMVEGRSLRDELKARERLTLPEAMAVAEAVCDALQAAHERGIIHRDLKPDNILLAEDKTADGRVSRIIKIADFGIVKLRGTQQGGEEVSMQLTKYGTPIGTPFYMSPEQWFGDGPGFTALDGRADLYSLGCTLYEALTGRPPFLGQTTDEMRRKHLNDSPQPLNELAPQVPAALSRVILRSLEKDRDLRPSSAADFAAELRRADNESRPVATAESAAETPSAKPEVAVDKVAPDAKQVAQMQVTEESVPLVRNWELEEAQQAIEHVRQQRVPSAPSVEHVDSPANNKKFVEERSEQALAVSDDFEATLVSGLPRAEAERDREDTAPSSRPFESELQQTLVNEQKQTGAQASAAAQKSEHETHEYEMRELIVAQVGARRIGLLADEAERAVAGRVPVPLPHAPEAVLGVVSVRGRMLTLLDPLALLGEKRVNESGATPAFIIPLRSDEQLALAADSISDAIKIRTDEIAPLNQDSNGSVVRGVVHSEHETITVLDTRELFDAATQGIERRRQRR